MRVKKVNRYYCDFCGKGGCSAGHMKKHEESCLKNPDRKCLLCEEMGFQTIRPTDIDTTPQTVADCENITECPCCILSLMVYFNIREYYDYHAEVEEIRKEDARMRWEKNEHRYSNVMRDNMIEDR